MSPKCPQRQRRSQDRHEQDHGEHHRERSSLADVAEFLAVQDDHRQGLAARRVEQARHRHLVQGGHERQQPRAEQRRCHRRQPDRAGGGQRRRAARTRGLPFGVREPVERPRYRPVRQRPQLGEVGNQDHRERPVEPAAVGDEQSDGERRAGDDEAERGRRGECPAGAAPFEQGGQGAEDDQQARGGCGQFQAVPQRIRGRRGAQRPEVVEGPVSRRGRAANRAGDRCADEGERGQPEDEQQAAAQARPRRGRRHVRRRGSGAPPVGRCAPNAAAGRATHRRAPGPRRPAPPGPARA